MRRNWINSAGYLENMETFVFRFKFSVSFLTFLFISTIISGQAEILKMRIVNEITNYGYNAFAGPDSSNQLTPKVPPADFSGPMHLKLLKEQCFSLIKQEYKYEFCPFNNVTQHEQTYRWNPYSGILGVWKQWYIVNNTFRGMVMANGDNCGDKNRETKVLLQCGTSNNLTEVSEPSTCNYLMMFFTPLACHEDALLVYPRLNETHRKMWDDLEQQLYDKEITEKGYNVYLQRIFWKAGLVSNPSETDEDVFKPYDSLYTCNQDYEKLLSEVIELRKKSKTVK